MPIFEFRCQECGEEFEDLVLGSVSDVTCKKCDSPRVEKLMSAASFKSSGTFTPASGDSSCTSCSTKACGT